MKSDAGVPTLATCETESLAVLVFAAEVFALRTLAQLLGTAGTGLGVVACVTEVEGLADVMVEAKPRVAIVDCGRADDAEAWTGAAAACAETGAPVVALVHEGDRAQCVTAWRVGARALVARTAPVAAIASAVHAATSGLTVLCPATSGLTRRIVASSFGRECLRSITTLSPREVDVVSRLCEGMSNAEIGRDLGITESTVKSHLSRVMHKWDARDRVEVVIRAARIGLVHLN